MSSHLKAELAATCSTLGRLHKGEYLIEPECIESVKDLIRYLKRDDESHEIRRYLGESKVLQNDLIHIAKSCPPDMPDLFDVTLRLLINLTTPTMLFYGEELPAEKIGRNIYLSLIGYGQDYKIAFCDVEFWNKICAKLTNFFEVDWSERSADDGIQIERMLMLLRNVLQVPADEESEKRPENDVTVHDKVLWALRQSQILELLLFVAANQNEEQYYLNLLEIFSLILREQNPKWLAQCDIKESTMEKNKDAEELAKVREVEKRNQNKYLNTRHFNTTFVMKGVKSFSNNDVICHKPLDKVNNLNVDQGKKRIRTRRNKIPVESERKERRSTFSVRLFLKEFCLEFLNNGFGQLMNVVKNRLDSGKSLAHDQTYYFWALKFFLDFTIASNLDVSLVKDCLSMESFHFIQTSMDNAFEHLQAEKKKTVEWVKRIHLILKAYHSLLETLLWMDCSKSPLVRSISREIKSELFYVVEYREMTLHVLLKYDPAKFSISYLRDLVETTHLFIKLLEEYSKQTKLIVQKVERKKSAKVKIKRKEVVVETREEKWEKIKDDVYDTLVSESLFPEIPPFDAALDIPIDDQKGRAMKNIQKFLHEGKIKDGIGLLRSSRQVWPENDFFGSEGMTVEDETMALQEICLADLGNIEEDKTNEEVNIEINEEEVENEEEENEEEEERTHVVERDFDIMDYKKRLVNKKVVEGCGLLLKNYKKNSEHTNHCVVKLLHRIGWECCMPAMLYQASVFWTLLQIMNDKSRSFDEINTFTLNLMRKFRKDASKNPVVFLELLFWKENNVALEIQHGYEPYESKEKPKRSKKKKKSKSGFVSGDEVEDPEKDKSMKKSRGRKKKNVDIENMEGVEIEGNLEITNGTKKRGKKKGQNGEVEENKTPKTRKKKTKSTEEDGITNKSISKSSMVLEDGSDREVDTVDRSEMLFSSEPESDSDQSDLEEFTISLKNNNIKSLTLLSGNEDVAERNLNEKERNESGEENTIRQKYKKRSSLSEDSEDELKETRFNNKTNGKKFISEDWEQDALGDSIAKRNKKMYPLSEDNDGELEEIHKKRSSSVTSQTSGKQKNTRMEDSSDEDAVGDRITQKYKKLSTLLEDSEEEMDKTTKRDNDRKTNSKSYKKENNVRLEESSEDENDTATKERFHAHKKRINIFEDSEDEAEEKNNEAKENNSTSKTYRKENNRETEENSEYDNNIAENIVFDKHKENNLLKNGKAESEKARVYNASEKFHSLLTRDNLSQKKDSDNSNDSSRFSDTSSKKRSRRKASRHPHNILSEEDSSESDRSQSKRRRYIGSDSEMDNYDSDDEGPILARKSKKRTAIIDSDSDLEGHTSLEDK